MSRLRQYAYTVAVVVAAGLVALVFGIGQASAQKRGGELHAVVTPEPMHLGLGMTGISSLLDVQRQVLGR